MAFQRRICHVIDGKLITGEGGFDFSYRACSGGKFRTPIGRSITLFSHASKLRSSWQRQTKVENMHRNEYAEPATELLSVLQIYFLQVSESKDALQPLPIAI